MSWVSKVRPVLELPAELFTIRNIYQRNLATDFFHRVPFGYLLV